MKKLFATTALTTLILAGTSHAGFIGPLPDSQSEKATTFTAGYLFSEADWETDSGALGADAELSQNQVFAQIGHRTLNRLNLYVRAGATNYEADNGIIGQADFDGTDYKPFGGIGFNLLLNKGAAFDLGIFAQAHLFASYSDTATIQTANGIAIIEQEINNPWMPLRD